MTYKEMESLWERMTGYRQGDKVVRHRYEFHDPYQGTFVNYRIGEYSVDCTFFCNTNDNWYLTVKPMLHQDVRFLLDEYRSFYKSEDPRIFEFIDEMIEALEGMPPVIDHLKKQYRANMRKIEKRRTAQHVD